MKQEVVFMKVKSFEEFKDFIDKLEIQGNTFVIKPNWVEPTKGQYTEPKALQWLCDCLPGKKIIIESHTAWRNKITLETGKSAFDASESEEKKDFMNEQENWFFEFTGLKQILDREDTEYVNVTEEVWKGEVVNSEIIQQMVEEKFPPVKHKELYGVVPKKIFELKNAVLIDFAKLKTDEDFAMTLSTKNLFGLIPDPKRAPKYHDPEKKNLPYAVLDINKIYRTLFDCIFINEGIFNAVDGPSPTNGRLKENFNLIAGGRNSIDVDLVTAKLVSINPEILLEKLLNPTREVFGFNTEILNKIPEDFVDKLNYKEQK